MFRGKADQARGPCWHAEAWALDRPPGIGPVSALQLLGELVLIPANCDVRQWVAYAGLDPRHHESGTSVHQKTRISKVGNRRIAALSTCPL